MTTRSRQLLKAEWEVIDGQQRLTAIFILLSLLAPDMPKYSLDYITRRGSGDFLENIAHSEEKKWDYIDFFHMYETWEVIHDWFDIQHPEINREAFLAMLKEKVQFIWYETVEKNPIKVFTRLNIGKIALTDAELIRALFLSRNSGCDSGAPGRYRAQEIASEWDRIEFSLQNDEFWLFIHDAGYTKPTRIDFIFDLMREQNDLQLNKTALERIGNDEHRTFRYFYEYFSERKRGANVTEVWLHVKNYFQIFEEWYRDLKFYHYIGFLIEQGWTPAELVAKWQGNKENFLEEIVRQIKSCMEEFKNLDQEYDIDGAPKTRCRSLLLLFNIQTIIRQNEKLSQTDKYGLGVFYKFPFHLLKKEKWDIEHIDSSSENMLDDAASQREWLENIWFTNQKFFEANAGLRDRIINFCRDAKSEKFADIREEIDRNLLSKQQKSDALSVAEKQKLWNFTLLDQHTNRGYHNDFFITKRRKLLGKAAGKVYDFRIDETSKSISLECCETDSGEDTIAFVPLCTRDVFLK